MTAASQRSEEHRSGRLTAPPCASRGTAHWRMQAGCRRVWARRAGACDRQSIDPAGRSRSHAPAVCEPPHRDAWASYTCAPSQVASKFSTLLMNSGSRQSCIQDFPLPRAVRIGRREICLHSSLWQEARIGVQADVASGHCVQLCLCHTPFPCALQDNEIEWEGYERPA